MAVHKPELTPSKGSHFEGNCNVEYSGTVEPEEREDLARKLQETLNILVEKDGEITTGYDGNGFRTVKYGDAKASGCGGTHASKFSKIGKISVGKISKAKTKGNIKVKYTVI